ncbi:Rubrerythrin [Desulfonispora thiosulfatigenes DSM 11270]|uniref:Rubrerythrin n=1 Tax=Desulfonispora thiosulfatigenes DSM 11270 TaxID=656914 RepID=A0A1W1UL21_DESTI|nr:Rubrerythrin [Desulfonispora thiosulfatigenes DSM 11270]
MLKLTQKEKMLLEDQKKHEELCIEKYTTYANNAQCPQLKQLFQSHAQSEQQHLDTINQLLNGTIPQVGQGQSGQSNQSQGQQSSGGSQSMNSSQSSQSMQSNQASQQGQNSQASMNARVNSSFMGSQNNAGSMSSKNSNASMSAQNSGSNNSYNANDASLCNDMLVTEKYISNAYDTAIFENTNSQVRQVLNHIQKEEQQHGEDIFNYMNSNGMYNPQ